MTAMYVVFVMARGERADSKVFSLRKDATAYAASRVEAGYDTADVYEISDAANPRAALAALQMGEGRFVEGRGRRATRAEIHKGLLFSLGIA